MDLQLATRSSTEVEAGYSCSCGCKPQLVYERGADNQKHVCCCGTQLVVGKDAKASLEIGEDGFVGVEEFQSPWGEILEAAWTTASGEHGHTH
jgi:hypothetical protein